MKKRLRQAFLETTVLLGWIDSQIINGGGIIPDDLLEQSMYNEKKYDKMARRLGCPTRYEELEEVVKPSTNNTVKFPLIING